MYADRAKRFSPVGAGAALAVNGALIAGLILAFAPQIVSVIQHKTLETYEVPKEVPPPPPVDDIKPKVDTVHNDPQIYHPPEVVPTHSDSQIVGSDVRIDTLPLIGPPATSGGDVIRETPVLPPPLIAAVVDPRYARDFQPDYPSSGIRDGTEGIATVRVLIGADGRVKSIEQVNATIPAFFDATRRQALAHWRFKPATRGGVPQESWKTMTVRFVLSGE
jgi:protein TonB